MLCVMCLMSGVNKLFFSREQFLTNLQNLMQFDQNSLVKPISEFNGSTLHMTEK